MKKKIELIFKMHNYVVYDHWQVFELQFGRTGALYLSWATSLQNNPCNKNKRTFLLKKTLSATTFSSVVKLINCVNQCWSYRIQVQLKLTGGGTPT